MMTVGEHDTLWKGGARSIINCESKLDDISRSLKRANGISILKELYNIGELKYDDYVEGLKELLRNEGFIWED